jgi:hypothetical protein
MLPEFRWRSVIVVIIVSNILFGCNERPTAYYPTWQEAMKEGAVTRGWIPSFLPKSSTNISETHDLDTNAGAFCFSAPSADLDLLVSQLKLVPASRFSTIGPWIDGSTTWWPSALRKKRFSELVEKEGFGIYEKPETNDQISSGRIWYFAINVSKDIAYGWQKMK